MDPGVETQSCSTCCGSAGDGCVLASLQCQTETVMKCIAKLQYVTVHLQALVRQSGTVDGGMRFTKASLGSSSNVIPWPKKN